MGADSGMATLELLCGETLGMQALKPAAGSSRPPSWSGGDRLVEARSAGQPGFHSEDATPQP